MTTVFPDTGMLRSQLKPRFTLKMLDCCLNLPVLPCRRVLPEWWVICRVVTGTNGCCARSEQKRPLCRTTELSWMCDPENQVILRFSGMCRSHAHRVLLVVAALIDRFSDWRIGGNWCQQQL